ncbi:hypothetical protein PAEH1_10350 [Paenalcaligenes hominis]|uniref:HTH luxR-type domain-containing protein n=1 Tax=Paenalcaligenes hominis TaxID=643674 RepID=A0A1U9K1C8_9BURK|nr:helix-turn-helix domain-containing protein [Paenalcaligenes hominis]AQS51850.1 hypothetical protein PAEH1_10350 [Paenalcaligenes hominis]
MRKRPLSPKERECLYWVALGKTSEEISRILGLSPHTVNFHIRNCFIKLNVSSRPAAIAKALAHSLLALPESSPVVPRRS